MVDLGDHDERESVEKVVAEVLETRVRRLPLLVVDRRRPLGDAARRSRGRRAARGARRRRLRRTPRSARGLPGRPRVHVPPHLGRRRGVLRLRPPIRRALGVGGRPEGALVLRAVARDAGGRAQPARRASGLRDARHRRPRSERRAGDGQPRGRGPGFEQLLEAVEALAGLDVVACDVVEVSPPLDPSGITQAAAALLVREMLLRFA